MKKYLVFICIFVFIFSLTGCNSNDLNELEMGVIENNKKVENIIDKYETNKEIIESFDILFKDNFTTLTDYNETINSYCNSQSITDSIISIQERVIIDNGLEFSDEDTKNDFFESLYSTIECSPMMNETTGSVEEIILIRGIDVYFILYWEDGFIKEYEYFFIN